MRRRDPQALSTALDQLRAAQEACGQSFSIDFRIDHGRRTLLDLAAELGSVPLCTVLLRRGAAVNAYDDYGYTPLATAADEGHADVCRLLLEWGASRHAPAGATDEVVPLLVAKDRGHTHLYALLRPPEHCPATNQPSVADC